MANLLIFGGNGKFANCFRDLYSAHVTLLEKSECDISNIIQVEKILKNFEGKYVLNAAAITDMEYCQKNIHTCFTINATSVYILNKVCEKYKKKLIQISSNYSINPPNTYGWTKHAGEILVDKNNLIIRTNFYSYQSYIINKILIKEPFNAYTNVFFNPVSINRVVDEVWGKKDKEGIINIFSHEAISYYDFAKMVCNEFNISENIITQSIYHKNETILPLALHSVIPSDIRISIKEDLKLFKAYLTTYAYY